MIDVFTQISKYLNVLLMLIFVLTAIPAVLNRKITRKAFGDFCFWQRTAILLFAFTNVGLIIAHEWGSDQFADCLKTFGILWGSSMVLWITMGSLHRGSNRILTNCIIFLLNISVVMMWRLRPYYAQKQAVWILISVVLINVEMLILRGKWIFRIPWFVWGTMALGLVVLPFIFPDPVNGSLNWVNIKGFGFQPSELIKPVLVFFLSTLFISRKRITSILTAGLLVGALSLVLLIQNDLGTILIFCSMFLLMVYDYTQKEWILLGGLALVGICAVLAYKFVGHVRLRVDIWMDPWTDVEDGGYQIAQSLFAITGGKFMGSGLYQGMPYMIPESWTDMIFSGISEEFGAIFAMMTVLIYLLMSLIMFNLVSRYEVRLRRNIAMAISIITSIQTILIIGGVIKMIPLTGVTLPLVSYGGTSMISIFLILGIVQELFRSRTQLERRVRAYEEEQRNNVQPARIIWPAPSINLTQRTRSAGQQRVYQQPVPGGNTRNSIRPGTENTAGSAASRYVRTTSVLNPYDFEEPEPWE